MTFRRLHILSKLLAKSLPSEEVDKIISTKLKWILENSNPMKILLFGSAAEGTMTTASDIDLILIFETDTQSKASRLNLFRTRPKHDWPHDLLFFTQAKFDELAARGGGACYFAKLHGKILYQDSGKK